MNYDISVIIPIFNVEQYIEECLQSVASQTKTEGVECLLIDDCGNDNSVALAEEFIRNYEGLIHFKMIHHEHNQGLSAARNTGICQSNGLYLYFLDSDDRITPMCLESMFSKITKFGNIDLVQGFSYESENYSNTWSNLYFTEYSIDKKEIKNFLLNYDGGIIGAQSRLINKFFLINNNLFFKEGIIHEDNYWTFFLAKYVQSMAFCPERTYYHRYNPNSITGKINTAKEILAYQTIITDLSANIDPFLAGKQKELILNNLLTTLDSHFYQDELDKKELINTFVRHNSFIEKKMLSLFFRIHNTYIKNKVLHILIRTYKLFD